VFRVRAREERRLEAARQLQLRLPQGDDLGDRPLMPAFQEFRHEAASVRRATRASGRHFCSSRIVSPNRCGSTPSSETASSRKAFAKWHVVRDQGFAAAAVWLKSKALPRSAAAASREEGAARPKRSSIVFRIEVVS